MFSQILSFPVERWDPCLFPLRLGGPLTNPVGKTRCHMISKTKSEDAMRRLPDSLAMLTCGALSLQVSEKCQVAMLWGRPNEAKDKETTRGGPRIAGRERGARPAPLLQPPPDCIHKKHLKQSTHSQPSHLGISDPQKPGAILNDVCCFKPASLGVMCYRQGIRSQEKTLL